MPRHPPPETWLRVAPRGGPSLARAFVVLVGLAGFLGCTRDTRGEETAPAGSAVVPVTRRVTLSILGTNDVHGRVARVALIGGYVENLRRARRRDGGAVILLDAGDMFQGTLESNMEEGAPMVAAFNALGYDAAALGNHEFDYGPVGPDTMPAGPDQDPRGALLARVAEMRFPLLVSNLAYAGGGRIDWPGVHPSVALDPAKTAGVRVGVVGATTEEALRSTLARNVSDLAVTFTADAVRREALALRRAGVEVVLLTIHAGGRCASLDAPDDVATCDPNEEVFRLARALGPGVVDAIVAGHTHWGVAHRVHGIPIIESFANGYAFGRIDLVFDTGARRIVEQVLYPPHPTCANDPEGHVDPSECVLSPYEGAPVSPHPAVLEAIREPLARAEALRTRSLGVTLTDALRRRHRDEGPLGNLLADVMLELFPRADLAILNAGGVRHSIPAGELTYGELYEAIPFDNRFALVDVRGRDVRAMYEENLVEDGGLLLLSGARVRARCEGDSLRVTLETREGEAMADDRVLTLVTNDFLATGERHDFARLRAEGAVHVEPGPPMRDRIAERLAERGGVIDPRAPSLFDPGRLRVDYRGRRPLRCPSSGARL